MCGPSLEFLIRCPDIFSFAYLKMNDILHNTVSFTAISGNLQPEHLEDNSECYNWTTFYAPQAMWLKNDFLLPILYV